MDNTGKQSEKFFQDAFLDFIALQEPDSIFVPKLKLKYSIGKYERGKDFGMPDTELDVVEFTPSDKQFHLWELKLIDSSEVWTGKFFGQILLYDFLFSTEPWNELLGRFIMQNDIAEETIKGDISKIIGHLAFDYGEGEEAKEDDPHAKFSSWNLLVCGGKGYELAAGFNPIIWHYAYFPEIYFQSNTPQFSVFHFYETTDGFELRNIESTSVNHPETLHPEAYAAFRDDYPDFFSDEEE